MSRHRELVTILAASQGITNAFLDFGDLTEYSGENIVGVTLNVYLTIGTSTDVQVKIVKMYESGGDAIELPLITPANDKMEVEPAVYEFALDANQKQSVDWIFDQRVSYWKVQAKDSAGGSGTIDKIVAEIFTE